MDQVDIVKLPECEFRKEGLVFRDPAKMKFRRWEQLIATLNAMEDAVPWWIGDALNFGEQSFGEKYAQAVEITGYRKTYLQNICWLSSRIPMQRRRAALGISMHQEVASLEPEFQDQWLKSAEENQLTRRELRHSIKQGKIMRHEEIDELSGRGSGIRLTLEGIMSDFQRWRQEELGEDGVDGLSREHAAALEEELRPAGTLWVQTKELLK